MGINKDRGRYLLSRCYTVKGVRVDKPIDWSKLECIECLSPPRWVGVNSKNEAWYVCQICKEELYEA